MYVRDKRSPVPKSEAVARVMSSNRAKNTKPELILRQALHQANARGYRLHRSVRTTSNSDRPPKAPLLTKEGWPRFADGVVLSPQSAFLRLKKTRHLRQRLLLAPLRIVDFGLSNRLPYTSLKMKPITFEKLVRMATFEELWASRKPDFKARNEIKTLKRNGITATYSRIDDKAYSVLADAMTKEQIEYLVLKRGFAKAMEKPTNKPYSDVVETILKRPRTGTGGGIPLTRGEVAMLFLDGHAGDRPWLLDIRSQGYGEANNWDGLTPDDVLEDDNTASVWSKWEPLELWPAD